MCAKITEIEIDPDEKSKRPENTSREHKCMIIHIIEKVHKEKVFETADLFPF